MGHLRGSGLTATASGTKRKDAKKMINEEKLKEVIEITTKKVFEAYDKTLYSNKDRTPQDREDYVYLTGFLTGLKYIIGTDEPNFNTTYEKYLKYQI